jgi:hypothetical protein
MELIGDAKGFKPRRSWFCRVNEMSFELGGNAYEASIVFDINVVRQYGYRPGQGDEHGNLPMGYVKELEVGSDRASYVYTWASGLCHASGDLGSTASLEERVRRWKDQHNDTGDGEPLKYVDMAPKWEALKPYQEKYREVR